MAGLIPLPDQDAHAAAPVLWVNPDHIVTATAIFDRGAQPHRLLVELKMQCLPLSRHVLAAGSDAELEATWSDFTNLLRGE